MNLWYVYWGEKMKSKRVYDIIIIGAGASGLMAAVAAKEKNSHCSILVLEKNPMVGKKIYATGNGKSNFLNRYALPENYFCRDNNEASRAFVQAVLTTAPVSLLENEFRRMGIVAFHEEDGRLYPRSLQAKSVVGALLAELQTKGVAIALEEAVKNCSRQAEYFTVSTQGGGEYLGRRVILASGGRAGCQYGSEGEGYKLAAAFAHHIIKPIPALTQVVTQEKMENIFGVRVRAVVCLWRVDGGKKNLVASDAGEVQFTKDGLSGICTFNVSRFVELAEGISYEMVVDPFEEYKEEQLYTLLLQRRQDLSGRDAESILYGLIPEKLCDEILKRAGISGFAKVKDLPDRELCKLAKGCKAIVFHVLKTKSWKDAQVTAGGVCLSEIDGHTLESKLQKGLFFAGEIMDVDGPCGGYNLGWAFASGYVAGGSAAEEYTC